MKRTIIILSILSLALFGHAQNAPEADSNATSNFKIILGLSAGATQFNNGNEGSPYYSKYGFFLQIPLCLHWQFAPKWELATGLRYDFNINPMYYTIERAPNDGIAFPTEPSIRTQHATYFSSYVGIPLSVTFHPWPKYKNQLGLSLDLFAGYAASNVIKIKDLFTTHTLQPDGTENITSSWEEDFIGAPIQPWKVELGMTLSTSVIGLVHGVRLFANLLPTYIDPATGEKIYTSGISLFL
ncbi:MAG: hypothetical protein II633_07815 [Bacteroidales bacterium]|nr:hypothetical protein [Bacteroidales bacterium]